MLKKNTKLMLRHATTRESAFQGNKKHPFFVKQRKQVARMYREVRKTHGHKYARMMQGAFYKYPQSF